LSEGHESPPDENQRINAFLSSHQSIRDIACNSMLSLVRNQSTSVAELMGATEPPVDHEFESGFIGSSDTDLWKDFDRLTSEDDGRQRGMSIERDILFALDEVSKEKGELHGLTSVLTHADLPPNAPSRHDRCLVETNPKERGVIQVTRGFQVRAASHGRPNGVEPRRSRRRLCSVRYAG
jgi:hypothetical protein